ncbi:hypothetical protein MJ572_05670 [Escherichia coli]|nr:hypothetical protein MJ572_05670 [Escherichia coli]
MLRQLRLRDLGVSIVIDFLIDMTPVRHQRAVENLPCGSGASGPGAYSNQPYFSLWPAGNVPSASGAHHWVNPAITFARAAPVPVPCVTTNRCSFPILRLIEEALEENTPGSSRH